VVVAGCEPASEGATELSRTEPSEPVSETASYVGSDVCAGCHRLEHEAWSGSHHQLAMALPTDEHVAGDFRKTTFSNASTNTEFSRQGETFRVRTEGADGELADFSVRYTFGIQPLQQYLLELPGSRLQAHSVAWDSRPESGGGQRWFHLHPDETVDHNDVLHWTRDGQNWNYMCADCHSTAVEKSYDAASGTYATEFAEISVGCEACHGPGSRHVENPVLPVAALDAQAQQVNACAPCHSRRGQLAEGFSPQRSYLDHYLPALLDEGLYYHDGQILDEVYVYGSFLQSKMHARGVTCSHCHEPHSGELRFAGNDTCIQCHSEAGRAGFPTLRLANYASDAHHFHAPDSAGARCVSCHMPEKTFMVIDDRRDHSFRIPRPDLTVELGVPNACNACHDDRSPEWARDVIADRFGAERPEHFAAVFAAARVSDPDAEAALAAIAEDAAQPPIVRATALSLMVRYERGMTSFALERGLTDKDPLVRIGALRGAERWEPARRFEKCKRLLNDDVLAVRIEAARLLGPAYGSLTGADQRQLQDSLEAYLQVLQLNADRAEAQTSMANVYLYKGNVARAQNALQTAMTLNDQWVPALVNLADLYRGSGQDEKAGPLLARAVELAPEAPDVLVAQALWLVRQDLSSAALPLLGRASQLAPENMRYAYIYAVALHSVGQSEGALAVLDEALLYRPRDEDLLRAAFGIARDAALEKKMNGYLQQLESRWSP
jgi:tetratricopeptide (TPR) repeat protein